MDDGVDGLDGLQVPGWRVQVVAQTLSTNQLAAECAAAGEATHWAVVADHQLGGKGRRGNRWECPPGSALLLSALLRPSMPMQTWPRLAVAAAVAVCRAIEATTSLRPAIKWPNDILVDKRKVAGILLESRAADNLSDGWVVVGVGVNVHARELPVGLRYPATSLALAGGHAPARAELAAQLLAALGEEARHCESAAGWERVLAAYAARDALRGHLIRAEQGGQIREGRASGLNHEGELLLSQDPYTPPLVLRDAHSISILD